MPPKRLLTVLAVLVLAGVLGVAMLAAWPKATVVELLLLLDEVSLVVVPQQEKAVELLHDALKVKALQWKGAARFEATVETPRPGRATARPAETGTVALRMPSDGHVDPAVKIHRPMRLTLTPSRRDRLTIRLDPVAVGPAGWVCEVLPRDGLELRLAGVELAIGGERFPDSEAQLARDGAPIVLTGGETAAQLGLRTSAEPRDVSSLRVIDPGTASSTPAVPLPLKLPQERLLLAAGDRLVLLEKQEADPEAGLLLTPNLKVRGLWLRRAGLRRESSLAGGRIRFLGGEKPPVELERDFLLQVPESASFTLKTLRMVDDELELVLWGRPSSLELGPSPDLMTEVLPSTFVWLRTHELPTLVFSTLVALVGIVVASLRLFGLVRKEE